MKPMTIVIIAIAVVAAGLVISDYFPRRADPETGRLKRAAEYAKVREAAAENALKAKEEELDHLHTLTVHDTAQVRRQKLAYDYAKTHLDTTSTDSLNAQLARADSVIDSQAKTIVDVSAERDTALAALKLASSAIEAADYRSESLERLNAGVEKELAATRRGQWKHDAKVVGATLATAEAVRAVAHLLGR
jgi:hypothetical protein